MSVFQVFKILQKVSNHATHHNIWLVLTEMELQLYVYTKGTLWNNFAKIEQHLA